MVVRMWKECGEIGEIKGENVLIMWESVGSVGRLWEESDKCGGSTHVDRDM